MSVAKKRSPHVSMHSANTSSSPANASSCTQPPFYHSIPFAAGSSSPSLGSNHHLQLVGAQSPPSEMTALLRPNPIEMRTIPMRDDDSDDDNDGGIKQPMQHGTFVSTTANILCTMIGGGILALPAAFCNGAIVPSLLMVLVSSLLCVASVYALVACCDVTGRHTFKEVAVVAFATHFPTMNSHRIGRAVEGLIYLSNQAILVVYMRVIADTVPLVIRDAFDLGSGNGHIGSSWLSWSFIATDGHFWMLVSAAFFVAMGAVNSLRELLGITILGVVAMIYIAFVVILTYFVRLTEGDTPSFKKLHITFTQLSGMVPAFSTIMGACFFQMNVPMLYSELSGHRRPRATMLASTVTAYVVAGVLYAGVGLLGYMTFGNRVREAPASGNIMLNYGVNYSPMVVGRVLMYVHLLCACPIFIAVARRSLLVAVFDKSNPTLRERVNTSFVIVALACAIGSLVPGIGVVMQYTGAIFGTTIGLTLPALLYYFLFPRIESAGSMGMGEATPPKRWHRSLAMAFVVLGAAQTLSSVLLTSYTIAED